MTNYFYMFISVVIGVFIGELSLIPIRKFICYIKSAKINSRPSDTDVTEQSRATGESPLGNHVQDAEVSTISDITVS